MSTRSFNHSLQELSAFVAGHHRLPRLGDPRPPWTYRGFLLPYVIQLHNRHPHIPDRWGYYFKIHEIGLVPNGIPRLSFCHAPDRATLRALERWIRLIEESSSVTLSFHLIVDWMAWALGVADNQPKLEYSIQEKLYRAVNMEPWLLHPYDYFGEMLAEQRSRGWNSSGFFPTPHPVCDMMVQMTVEGPETTNGNDPRTRSVMDPCCGTGRMLLHASNYSLNLYGMDIDPLVLTITKINGALYCPWLAFPLPTNILKTTLVPDGEIASSMPAVASLTKLPANGKDATSDYQLTFQF